MRSTIKAVGALFVLVLALSGIAAASASAAEPELLPGAGGKIEEYTFSAKSAAGKLVAGSLTITCESDTLAAANTKITTSKHFTATIDFEQCGIGGVAAVSLGDKNDTTGTKKGLILTVVLGLLCTISTSPLITGVFFELTPVHIEVPTIGSLIEVTGSVIGTFAEKDQNVLKTGVYTLTLAKPNVKECGGKKASLLTEEEHSKKTVASEEITTEEITFGKDVTLDG